MRRKVVAVHSSDPFNTNSFGARLLAFTVICAPTKVLFVHLLHHGQYALIALWLTLGE
jgi:hypothetical protein